MSRKVRFTVHWMAPARDDLEEIADYIALNDGVDAAVAVLARIEKTAATLTSMPHRGRSIPELANLNMPGYREIICRPWRIAYETKATTVTVHAVLDGRRDVRELLAERFGR